MVKVSGKYGAKNNSVVCCRYLQNTLKQIKDKAVLVRALKECKESGGLSPLILNLRTRRR